MFESARSKVRRAEKHISDLQEAFQRFVADEPYTIAVEHNTKGWAFIRLNLTKPIPDELGLIIGDTIHNLRSALDHATWELFGLDGGTQDRWTTLPTGSNWKDYEARCRGLKTPRDDTKQFFIDLAVHPTGPGATIYKLHELDNTDKHCILTPLIAAGRIVRTRGTEHSIFAGDDWRPIWSRIGKTPKLLVSKDSAFELDKHTKVIPDVLLRDWQGRKSVAAVPALTMLVEDVSVILDTFDAFMADRIRYGR